MKLKFIYISLFIAAISMVSCDNEDYTGHSKVNFTAPTATYAIVANNTNLTVDESMIDPDADEIDINTGDYAYGIYIVEATIPNAVQFDTYIDLTQTGGTANSSDFEVSRIKIPALETSGIGMIKILKTGDQEGDETLEISTNQNSTNINGSQTFTFDINGDYLNDNFIFKLDWCNDFSYDVLGDGTITGNLGDEVDLDMYVYDSTFADTGNYQAATSACPEEFNFASLPNGTYYILIDVYANNLADFGINKIIDVHMSYEEEFFIANTNFINNFSLSTDTSTGTTPVAQVDKISAQEYVITAL